MAPARGQTGSPPAAAAPFVDAENPFGPAGDRGQELRSRADAGGSFEELVAEIFPGEEVPSPVLLLEEPRSSRLRWFVIVLVAVVAAAGVFVFRDRLAALLRGGGEAVRESPAADAPGVLAVPAEPGVPAPLPVQAPTAVAEPTMAPAAPSPTPVPPPVDPASLPPATHITAARWEATPDGGVLVLQGNGGVVPRRIRRLRLADPPRELLRITGILVPTEPETVPVGGPLVTRVRFGHHPELTPPELYVVMDLTSAAVQAEAPETNGDTIRIVLR